MWLIIPLHFSDVWICVHAGSLARRLSSITNRVGRVYNGKGSLGGGGGVEVAIQNYSTATSPLSHRCKDQNV